MKHLIQSLYQEPKVDTARVLKNVALRTQKKTDALYWITLINLILGSLLFVSFMTFLVALNIAFMPLVFGTYAAFGWLLFVIINIAVAIGIFILEHAGMIFPFVSLVALVQLAFLSLRREN